eukprot:901650-Rhodomonas_salina.2
MKKTASRRKGGKGGKECAPVSCYARLTPCYRLRVTRGEDVYVPLPHLLITMNALLLPILIF